ncbi:hypothetical protein H4P1_00013 (plasmid) [Variovorax sp. PBS-H4]|uniref:hypothetical protein n=1 Tax=Variovorax sp. PBS-H4 TaxID=434008 RepID=UPI00131803FD|nr:hypothetical protein [Variovorax sp. PBS-H4]VTU41381.1 hypothetical protein H4P1_00013 [Variovorax sp. PBS-H4]
MIPIGLLTRQLRETLEVAANASGPQRLAARLELEELTDRILEARILDGIDPVPNRVDISHPERDLP